MKLLRNTGHCINVLFPCLSWQHWHQHEDKTLQELHQPVQESRLLAWHLHGACSGTPYPWPQQQAQDRECTRGQDQSLRVRPAAKVRSRESNDSETGGQRAEDGVEKLKLSVTPAQVRSATQADVSAQSGSSPGRGDRGSPAKYQILQMPQTPAKSSLAHSFPSRGAGREILCPEVCRWRRKRLREAQKQQQLFIKHREKKNEGRCRWGCWISVPWISLHWSGLASGKSRTSSPGTNGLPSWWTSRWDYGPEFSCVCPVTVSEKSLDFKPIQQGKIHDSRKEYTERKRLC